MLTSEQYSQRQSNIACANDRYATLLPKLLADIIVPLHADGVVQGMTSLILMPVHVFALSIFASFFVIYIVKLRDP